MTARLLRLAAVVATAALCGACSDAGTSSPQPVTKIVTLDQGWDAQTRESFHFTPQGSQIIPYGWFLVLEQADGTRRFASDENMASYRYLPTAPSTLNPDGLPIGFVKHVDPQSGSAYVGLTCAACHTTEIDYQGTGVFIDGAGTLGDFNTMFDDLIEALNATATDGVKFDRFADAVLGPKHSAAQAASLHDDLVSQTTTLQDRSQLNATPTVQGFARVDAFGVIFNELLAAALDEPSNAQPPVDPVSYPFLWTTAQLDLVQWNGSATNAGLLGPLTRNVGEVIGVFGGLELLPGSKSGYPSTIDMKNLGELEKWVGELLSPQWPGDILPAIDAAAAARGQAVYAQHCVGCHQLIDRTDTNLDIAVNMIPASEVGTDPSMATNFADRTGLSGALQGTPEYVIAGDDFGPTTSGAAVLDNAVIGAILNQPFAGLDAAIEEYRQIKKAASFNPVSYKARPLNGIWATAPYLHNGSVPSLYELMLPPQERVTTFYVGSREYDPVHVGFVTQQTPGAFLFDTSLAGNSNQGHAYGGVLSDDERASLIEFLKTL
jgi:hypothetical protein